MIPFLEVKPAANLDKSSIYLEHQVLPKKPAYWHYHPELEIIYIINGSGSCQVGDYLGNFKPGDFFIFGNNLPHDLHVEGSIKQAELLLIQIKPELLESNHHFEELAEVLKIINLSNRGIYIENFYSESLTHFLENIDMNPLNKLLTLLELFKNISQDHWMQRIERLSSIKYSRNPSFSKNDHLAHDRLNTVIKYIQENYQNSINLEDMANQTFMVPAAFSRWFKQTMNIGFNEYLNKYRVEEACRQMISTQKTLTMISEDCGFDSHSTFNRAFLKAKNISPGKYRTHVRNAY